MLSGTQASPRASIPQSRRRAIYALLGVLALGTCNAAPNAPKEALCAPIDDLGGVKQVPVKIRYKNVTMDNGLRCVIVRFAERGGTGLSCDWDSWNEGKR